MNPAYAAAWVPLAELPQHIVDAIGGAGADAAAREILTAIMVGLVPVRWSADIAAWRHQQREMGRELQHASGIQAGAYLAPPGRSCWPAFVLDTGEGIALAPGDPADRKPSREGVWPVGPVELAWPQAFAVIKPATQHVRRAA